MGEVTNVGSNVTKFKIGDRAGVRGMHGGLMRFMQQLQAGFRKLLPQNDMDLRWTVPRWPEKLWWIF
jgi:NADPH:quinone reductase-like Zn-dependent oxidoreductase